MISAPLSVARLEPHMNIAGHSLYRGSDDRLEEADFVNRRQRAALDVVERRVQMVQANIN